MYLCNKFNFQLENVSDDFSSMKQLGLANNTQIVHDKKYIHLKDSKASEKFSRTTDIFSQQNELYSENILQLRMKVRLEVVLSDTMHKRDDKRNKALHFRKIVNQKCYKSR